MKTLTLNAIAIFLFLLTIGNFASGVNLAEKTLVVFNADAEHSQELAAYYAEKRSIPPKNILGLHCDTTEEITREHYQTAIYQPIETYLLQNSWLKRVPLKMDLPELVYSDETHSSQIRKISYPVEKASHMDIWIIVLIRGVPLKIKADPTIPPSTSMPPNLQANCAAVDSELSLMPTKGLPLSGPIFNPYYSNQAPERFNQTFADKLTLVARLDGPTPATVRRMIDDALETEKTELTGKAYFDARGIRKKDNGYFIGDHWIRTSAETFQKKSGFLTLLDDKAPLFPPSLLLDSPAIYGGWYAPNISGAFKHPAFHFRKGAIAYHLHSFSATTLHSTHKGWSGPLLSKGAAATMGSVYEPFLRFTPEVSTFFASLLDGMTFIESAYRSQSALSWMITMVGDPLYRPFPRDFHQTLVRAAMTKPENHIWLLLRSARLQLLSGKVEDARHSLENIKNHYDTAASWEGYADLLLELDKNFGKVLPAYQKAIEKSASPYQKVRIYLKIADTYRKQKKIKEVLEIYETCLVKYPKAAAATKLGSTAARYASDIDPALLSPFIRKLVENLKPKEEALPSRLPSQKPALAPALP